MTALRRYSLIRPAGDGTVSVHRLVQAVTADHISERLRDAWGQAGAPVIEAAIPTDSLLSATWPVFAALQPHAPGKIAPSLPASRRA